jgi:uncharacterized phage protein gp47/JayE
MPFTIPTIDEIHELLIAAASGRFPSANLNRRSDIWKHLRVVALGLGDVHNNLRIVQNDLQPDTAEGDALTRWGAVYGVDRRGAVGSTGEASLRVFGDLAATVPVNEPLTHLPSGLTFETRSGGTIPAAGFLDVDIAATSSGVLTNLEADEELTFDSTPTGLESTARVTDDLTGGLDEEQDDALRTRLLNRIGQPAAGGNRNDYEQFVLEAAAYVESAYVYPNRNGLGTVDLVALKSGTGTERLLDLSERTDVLAAVDAVRPVSAIVRILEVTTLDTNVDVIVKPSDDPSFAFDWTDATPPAIATYVGATRVVTLTAARPTDMGDGDRVTFATSAVGNDGRQYVIESIDTGNPLKFTLVDALPFTPVAASVIYSGGPLVAPARDAIIALFDALGTANPDDASYGPWEGNLRLSTLFKTIQLQDGVLDSTIITPVANVEANDPAFPDNDTVELLTPGRVIVRKDNT